MKKTRKLKIKHPVQRQMLNDLSSNLNCEVLAYQELLQLASKIQNALLSDESEQILIVASQQAKLARELQAYEEARISLCEKLAASFALSREGVSERPLRSSVNSTHPSPSKEGTPKAFGVGEASEHASEQVSLFSPFSKGGRGILTQLISLVPEPYATKYATFRNELRSLISKLDVLCFQNARLISSNIKYIDEMLSLLAILSGNSNSTSTYINTGKIDNSQYNPRVLDYNL